LDALDALGFNFMHYAALEGNKEVIEMLLEKGVPPTIVSENHQRIQPIHWACLRSHIDIVLLLLDRGADIEAADSEGHTPLQKASQYGQTKLCQTLVARGCAVDQTDRHGHTALHWAAYMGKLITVEFLLRHGADINLRDSDNKTPLHRAIQQSQACAPPNPFPPSATSHNMPYSPVGVPTHTRPRNRGTALPPARSFPTRTS
jgi:ankyrin repeat protein